MLLGLGFGVVLVHLSIGQTRWLVGRLRPESAGARALELRCWGGYLGLAALIYVGFALREPGRSWMPVELGGLVVYTALGVLGATRWPLLLPVGWALHGAWDFGLHADVPDGFVPTWYRQACLSFDVVAALYLARLARR